VSSLLAAGAIDHFFFIRYEAGGPHLRLRLRAATGAGDAVELAVKSAAADFFSRWPSTQSLPAEVVRRRTLEILATDPAESDAAIHPDNSLRIGPFVPEVDRYGGDGLIGASLDFFALSSLRALDFARRLGGEPRSRQLPGILRALARQALGFARDHAELLTLCGYSEVSGDHPLTPFVARGDRAFEGQPEVFAALLAAEAGSPPCAEARALERAVAAAAPGERRRILASHMHMTANRLGLRNPEEAYFGRILQRAARALGEVWRPAPAGPLDARESLEDRLQAAFAAMNDPEVPAATPAGARPRR
jgi:hypothetical protein